MQPWEPQRDSLGHDGRYVELLLRAGEILANALDWEQTIDSVCLAVVETIADICILDLKDYAGELRLIAAAHRNEELMPHLVDAGKFLYEDERGIEHPVIATVKSRSPLCIAVVDEPYLRRAAVSREHERFMRVMRYRSLMVVPLISETQGTLGALTFVRTLEGGPPYDEGALRFATDLARRCATAISKARLYEQTLHIATTYQRAALPSSLPSAPGISLDAFYEPSSEELLVGGDWYDAFELRDGRIAISIGDVLGHGVEAAVWMSRLRNGLRAALFSRPDPAHALEVANELLRREFRNDFTTALVSLYDPYLQTLSCASAGHPGPLVRSHSGRILDPFHERGLPLGLSDFGEVAKTAQVLTLEPGSFAVFFTDGLLEWNRDIPKAWEYLQSAIARQDVREALHPAHAIRVRVIDGASHQDDIAILTIRIDATVNGIERRGGSSAA